LAEELVVLFVGAACDADVLASRVLAAALPAHVTRVSSWRALSSVSAGWDVVVAGGPQFPAQPGEVREGVPEGFPTQVLAITDGAPPPDTAGGRIEWFHARELGRILTVLRALRRASIAEGRQRQADRRLEVLELQMRQAGRLHAVGQMAAGVAHEFNNVLTVISGYCEQLLPQLRGAEGLARLVTPIQTASRRGAELSQRLLTFSRQSPVVGDASLTQAINDATAMLVPLLGENVSLRTNVDRTLPRVRGTLGQLIEVITNLAVNARDAMPSGGVLTIKTRKAEPGPDGQDRVALVVTDTGVGMTADTLAQACDPFFTTKAAGAGTGLGLSLVHDVVNQCGGSLTLRSEPGQGTEVTVVWIGVRPDIDEVEAPAPEVAAPGGFETVLVVEDDPAVREIVIQFLRGAAYHALEARDGAEAREIIRKEPRAIDLLVSDIVLPGQSGPELAGTLREFAPQMRTLFISGYPSEAVGGNRTPAFLAKPFSRAAFLQAVRRALSAPRYRDPHTAGSPGRLSDRERTSAETIVDGPH
jgi:signal transduction histidine kinase/CheY-like chemotaxis protein